MFTCYTNLKSPFELCYKPVPKITVMEENITTKYPVAESGLKR